MDTTDIFKPVEGKLKEFNGFFKAQMSTKVALLDLILRYMTRRSGKQVRPGIVFLAAELCGELNERAFVGAAMVELLHTATLIHDDVVDSAKERRGIASINAEWNNKIAVLVGDYLLSRGLMSAVERDEFDFLKVCSRAVKRISEGELLSMQASRKPDTDEELYFRIIADKTASLISACSEIGAIATDASPERRAAMRDYGEYVGIAFQIKDDVLDYTSKTKLLGKPVGNDIKEKKITLPLLYFLKNSADGEAADIIKSIKKGKLSGAEIANLINRVIKSGGIDYAEKKAREYGEAAKNLLKDFPASEAKDSLIRLADFVTLRDK
ncbi:MAG: polyprenyl synthetase family protein [Chloroflexota bacterium]